MNTLSKKLAGAALVGAMALGTLGVTATTASAGVACNRFGECWHVADSYTYPTGLGIVVHDDAWGARHRDHRWHWRDNHDGRGYYRNGIWIAF